MATYNSGVQTKRDDYTIHFTSKDLDEVIDYTLNNDVEAIREKYNIAADGRDWAVALAKEDIKNDYKKTRIIHKPFDQRFTAYTGRSKGFIAYPREFVAKHIVEKDNCVLVLMRQFATGDEFNYALITENLVTDRFFYSSKGTPYMFPMYLFSDDGSKTANLDSEIWHKIDSVVGESKPENILDYIYAILHSPSYREKYKEFLKIDFPRIPYPESKDAFWKLVELGCELRELHLLKSSKVSDFITTFPVGGDNKVTRKMTKTSIGFELTDKDARTGKVWINDSQYFGDVPETVWEFYVGGYQPAQKWFKDRFDRVLSDEDIDHYQKMIVSMNETMRIMKQIDEVVTL